MDTLTRTLPTTRRVLGDVDPAQPLDPTHPLTDGLQGFWLPLPGLVGGSRLYDLSSFARHGDFKNKSATDWAVTSEQPMPILSFSRTASRAGVNLTPRPGSARKMTVQALVRFDSLPNSNINPERRVVISTEDDFQTNPGQGYSIALQDNDNKLKFGVFGDDTYPAVTTTDTPTIGKFVHICGLLDKDNNRFEIWKDGKLKGSASHNKSVDQSTLNSAQVGYILEGGGGDYRELDGAIAALSVHHAVINPAQLYDQARRGFPDLLRRRDSVGLLGGGGGPSPISGTAAITDAQEQISATGQAKVSGTFSVTDGSETLTINGATKISGTTSITDAVETVLASGTADVQGDFALTDSGEIITTSGSVITNGSLSITGSGEIISAVSSLQDITGTAQITDAAEEIDATGEVKIAGTASLADGTEEVVIIGQNDVTGSFSFADLAAEIAATGSVKVQGSLALTDLGESISARERVPARLARVNVRLEDIIVVHATLEDALTVDAKLTD